MLKLIAASCNRVPRRRRSPRRNPLVWTEIAAERPARLLLLGDNVYFPGAAVRRAKRAYARLRDVPTLVEARKKLEVRAIWDDHDFGFNNARGANYSEAYKRDVRRLFNAEWNPRRDRGAPIHFFEDVGPVRIVMLDVRTWRTNPGQGEDAHVLGQSQLDWLRGALQHSGQYTLVCSGSTISDNRRLGDGKPRRESLCAYKHELAELVKATETAPHPIFVSGDVHFNKLYPAGAPRLGGPVPFPEIITSGVVRKLRGAPDENLGNYAVLTFSDSAAQVELRSNDPRQRTGPTQV